jgi:hypothetical protein
MLRVVSAVYEHLLPKERKSILKQIWSILKPCGILFLNQTPYRYFPVETHTTSGLPFINYLPDKLALYYAHHFSKRMLKNKSWEQLLKKGIRGGSVKEILNILGPQRPILLKPSRFEMKDRIVLWYIKFDKETCMVIKRLFLLSVKLLKWLIGVTVVPRLSLAIKKGEY